MLSETILWFSVHLSIEWFILSVVWVRDALLRFACRCNRSASMQRERSPMRIGPSDPGVVNESPRRTHPCETSDLVSMLVARFCDPKPDDDLLFPKGVQL
jgi:hypothetical protein